MGPIKVVQNDKLYDLNFTLQNADGTALDITGVSSINFKVQRSGSDVLKFTGTMSAVNSGTDGKCKYNVQVGNFDKFGDHYAEIEVVYSSGQTITFPGIYIKVEPELPKDN